MKKIIIIVLVLILVVGLVWYLSNQKSKEAILSEEEINPSEELVGGDKDEHGCIASAGYSWCEPKDKCLRIWEEECYDSAEEEIQYFLAGKYNEPVEKTIVNITKQTEDHIAGSIKFGQDSLAGGMFLAVRFGNMWEVVYDGNGSVDCEKMRIEYNFPEEILKPNFCD